MLPWLALAPVESSESWNCPSRDEPSGSESGLVEGWIRVELDVDLIVGINARPYGSESTVGSGRGQLPGFPCCC